MATETEEWILKLVDQASGNAARMAGGLGALGSAQLKAASSALALDKAERAAGVAMAKAAADPGNAAKAAAAKDAQARAALQAAKAMAADASKGLGGDLAGAASGATQAGGAVGMLQSALAKLGPEGQAAAVALGLITIAATAVIGTLALLASKAIEVTQHLGLMAARFSALAGSAAGGKAVAAMVEKLSGQLPFATAQIEQWASALQRAGFAGKGLEEATKAVAAAAAINPEGGAQAATELLSKLAAGGKEAKDLLRAIAEGGRKGTAPLREMGLTLADLGGKAAVAKMTADQLGKAIEKALAKKGAGPLAAMGLDLGVMIDKVKEGFASLFADLGPSVEPFMRSIKALFGEFSKGGGAIKALKPTVTEVLGTLFAWAKRATDAVHEVVQGFMNSKKAHGPFAELGRTLRQTADATMGLLSTLKRLDNGSSGQQASASLRLFLLVIQAVAGAVATMIDNATMALAILDALGDIASNAGALLSGLGAAAREAASSIVGGLVGGLDFGAFIEKMKGLALAGLNAFKAAFGIASHSKVMVEHGRENIAGATAAGVDKGADKMDASMERLASPPTGEGTGGGGKKGGERVIRIELVSDDGVLATFVREVVDRINAELANEAPT